MSSPFDAEQFLGPIKLAPGVAPKQIFIFVFVIISAYCMLSFMPLMQGFVFNEILHIPRDQQGRLAGHLVTVQQTAVLIFVGIWGGLSDRFGRKSVLVGAMLGYVVCLFLYPLAGAVFLLFILQFAFGTAWAGHTIGGATMMVDLPDNTSRGKFVSLMVVVQGIASALLVGYLGSRVPAMLVHSGLDAGTAGRYAFWTMSAFGLVGVFVAWRYLRNVRTPTVASDQHVGLRATVTNLRRNFSEVLAHAKRSPPFALVMLMGIVIRSDYSVILSFLGLWVINSAATQQIGSVEALKTAGTLTAVFQVATIVAPPIFGYLADRIDRTKLLVGALVLTGLSMVATSLISNVFGIGILVVVGCIGVTESALIIGAQTVFGESSPPDIRGSAQGIFAFLGTFSVILISFIGGYAFDKLGYTAPFVMVGSLNLVFAVLGIFLVRRNLAISRAATSAAAPAVSVDHHQTT